MTDDWDADDALPAEWTKDVHALTRTADEARAGLPAADLALRLMRDRRLAARSPSALRSR